MDSEFVPEYYNKAYWNDCNQPGGGGVLILVWKNRIALVEPAFITFIVN